MAGHNNNKDDSMRLQVSPLTVNDYRMRTNDIEIFLCGKGLWRFVRSEASAKMTEDWKTMRTIKVHLHAEQASKKFVSHRGRFAAFLVQ